MDTIFVFSGGNTKGSFGAGAAHTLIESGIMPDLVYGTSIGAINSFVLSRLGHQAMYDFWWNIEHRSKYVRYNWRSAFYDGVYDFTPLYKFLQKIEKASDIKQIPAKFCVVDLNEGDTEFGETIEYAIASATEPLMKPLTKRLLVDGGIRQQNCLQDAVKHNPKKIFAILNAPIRHNVKYKKTSRSLLEVTLRSIDIMIHEIFLNDLMYCKKLGMDVTIIAPDEIPYDPLTFDRKLIRNNLLDGVAKAKEAVKL